MTTANNYSDIGIEAAIDGKNPDLWVSQKS
jgi:hypothetical protein